MKIQQDLAICICTYRRTALLMQLVQDIAFQTVLPRTLIIVDGSPDGETLSCLKAVPLPANMSLIYIPSNHPNQPYQRYLGWLATLPQKKGILLYFDDDIRLLEEDVIEKLLLPFGWPDRNISGITAMTSSPSAGDRLLLAPVLMESQSQNTPRLARWFGSSTRVPPGGLTPTGLRRPPKMNGSPYVKVDWMQGRVMTFRIENLDRTSFPDDLFAAKHLQICKGEDTIISRKMLPKGELLLACDVAIEHPDADLPTSYPYRAYQYGFATAYSRRMQNDHYRVVRPPEFTDRLALLYSYFGTNLINMGRAIAHPARHRFAFALGYFLGSLRGLMQSPTAKNLTPDIDWWAEAELALKEQVRIQ